MLLVISRLAVGCPLRSTLVRSSGADTIALSGNGAAAGFVALPSAEAFPRPEAVWLPRAGEARIVAADAMDAAFGTCTMVTDDETGRVGG